MKRLLVVEDDIDIRESLQEFLLGEGYRVETAENGADALDLLKRVRTDSENQFDLILLDLMMPVMNGIEFRKHQVADPELRKIPVIVISADNRTRAIAAEIGLHRCVLKPMNLEDLLTAIEETPKEVQVEAQPGMPVKTSSPKSEERSAW